MVTSVLSCPMRSAMAREGRVAELDEQAHVAVAQVVNADALDAGGPASPLHFVVEKRLRDLEDALVVVAVVVCEMLCNLVDQKVGQLHHAC